MATNPYLQDQANAITQTATNNLNNNILPGLNAGAMQAGGFGGSRQGIAQGLAIGQTNQGITNSLAGLYGNAYEGDQNRANQAAISAANNATQQAIAAMQNSTTRDLGFGNLALGNKNADNSYNLGLGNLGLGYTQANQNFYTSQRGQDLQQMGLGAQLAQQGNAGLQGQGSALWNLGLGQQQAPWQSLGNLSSVLHPYTGLNNTDSKTMPGASALNSAMAGGLTAAQLWALLSGGK